MEDIPSFELNLKHTAVLNGSRPALSNISNIPSDLAQQNGKVNVADASSNGKEGDCMAFATHVAKESSSRGLSDFESDMAGQFNDEEITAYMQHAEDSGMFTRLEMPANPTVIDGGVRVPFVEVDDDLQREVDAGGAQKSADKIAWARKRFDLWREFVGLPCNKKIEDMELPEFAVQLERFMLQVTKCNGQFYPTESLQDMFRKFGSIIRRKQEITIANTGVQQYPFDIRESPIFERARLACVAAMRRSRRTPGVCKKRKKVDEIPYADELALLADIDHQINHPKGLQRRFLYYCVSRFAIRGQKELHLLVMSDFSVGAENGSEYLEYDERTSKNYDADMNRYQEEQFRLPCKCYEADVVLTYRQLLRHSPAPKLKDDGTSEPIFCFMQPIVNHKGNVWYNSFHRVSGRKLASWMKYMMKTVGVEGKFSGKSGRTTAISRMARAGVPQCVGMRLTGQRTAEAYSRYDKNMEVQQKCAMSVVSKPFDENGQRRMYEDVYSKELEKLDDLDRDGSAIKEKVLADSEIQQIKPGTIVNSAISGLLGSLQIPTCPLPVEISSGQVVQPVLSVNAMDNAMDSAMDSADIQLNKDLDTLSEMNPVVRKAMGMQVNVGSITGGSFQNCNIVMPCISREELNEVMVSLMRNRKQV